jgi:PAS domain S-box-containing protein
MRWDGAIEFWNRGAEERYGWRREEATGQVAHELLHTEFPEPLPEIKGKLERDGYWQGELVQSKRDGSKIEVASRWAVRRDIEDRPCGYMEILTDITERKRIEAQMQQSQRLESLGVLAGGIAHDFNNLLVVILGNASLALEVLGKDGPAKKMLEHVVDASEKAAGLTRQLLAYAGKEQLATRPIDLSNLVHDVIGLLRASIPKNVHLTLELQDPLPSIAGDSTQLQQVIMNLVINSAEAIPEYVPGTVRIATGARKPTISEQAGAIIPLASVDQDYVVLTIADTGTGISPEIRARIFEPFYTTKFTGRGLGLSAVLGIVKAHRGSICLQTALGGGSIFSALFPPEAAPVLAEIPTSSNAVGGNGTILVIDDESMVRKLAEEALQLFGYQVLLAENGRQGIDLLAAHPEIVAIVLDLAMPVMRGDQAAPVLRRVRPAVPIILSSGYSETEARQRFGNIEITAFLQKPYQTATFIKAVSAVLKSG